MKKHASGTMVKWNADNVHQRRYGERCIGNALRQILLSKGRGVQGEGVHIYSIFSLLFLFITAALVSLFGLHRIDKNQFVYKYLKYYNETLIKMIM